jgi:hypothetical protein
MMYRASTSYHAPYAALGLLLGGVAWLYVGGALASAYADALWTDPTPLLVGASLAWAAVGAIALIGLHVYLLVRVWRGD